MSRLDLILAFVDDLNVRSDRTVSDSHTLVNSLIHVNHEISLLDSSIDDIRGLIHENHLNLGHFSNLYEKSFYLESNLHLNDNITNQTSFETLTNEFRLLVKKLEPNDAYPVPPVPRAPETLLYTVPDTPETLYEESFETQETPQLSKAISMSNLKLRPIRCNTKQVYKKKSKYRLLDIYNIIPVAYEESTMDEDLIIDPEPEPEPQRTPVTASVRTISSNFMDNDADHHHDHDEHTVSSYSMEGERVRSNSLPESTSTVTLTNKKDNLLSAFGDDDQLRLNRLKHFISYNNFQPSEITPTPAFDINDHSEFDNLSICSDLSYYSPKKQSDEEFDDYERFLRLSRVDFSQVFPHINKSTSHDSIFNPPPPAFKFHNPAEGIQTLKAATTQVCAADESKKNKKKVRFAQDESKRLLSEMMKNVKQKPTTPESSPSKLPFSLFNFSISPAKSDQPRRSSISKSFTDSLMNLVGPTPPSTQITLVDPFNDQITDPTKPISIKNETQSKRMPIRIPGAHSNLTIANKTKIINHGESSMFKKPVMIKLSRNSLREALSESFY